jgi:hypothetical protein
MGLWRIWTISHGHMDHSRHCRRGRCRLAPTIRFLTIARLARQNRNGAVADAVLGAPRVDRPTSTGAGGSDPLWHCWREKPARDPKIKLLRIHRGILIYRKSKHRRWRQHASHRGSLARHIGSAPIFVRARLDAAISPCKRNGTSRRGKPRRFCVCRITLIRALQALASLL